MVLLPIRDMALRFADIAADGTEPEERKRRWQDRAGSRLQSMKASSVLKKRIGRMSLLTFVDLENNKSYDVKHSI